MLFDYELANNFGTWEEEHNRTIIFSKSAISILVSGEDVSLFSQASEMFLFKGLVENNGEVKGNGLTD